MPVKAVVQKCPRHDVEYKKHPTTWVATCSVCEDEAQKKRELEAQKEIAKNGGLGGKFEDVSAVPPSELAKW